MRGAFGKPGVPFLLSRRAHLLTTSSSQSPLLSVSAAGGNCERSLAPPLPTKFITLRGPLFGGGIACGNRALCEADAAPAGAFGQCHPLLRVLSSSTQSAMCFASSSKQLFPFWKQLADCLHKPATGSFVAERVSQFTTPFSFSQKKQKSKNERTVRTNGNLSS